MHQRLYAILDKVAEEAGPVLWLQMTGLRFGSSAISPGISLLLKRTYVLCYLGNYDSVKMVIDPAAEGPQEIMTGSQVFGVVDATEGAK